MEKEQVGKYIPDTVVLSFGISFLGAYMAISISEQLRQSVIEDKAIFGSHVGVSHRKKHLLYLLMMALSIGGIGIWAMHFIGMHAFKLYDIDGHHAHVRYNLPVSIASFFTCIVTTFIGVTIASYDVMFSKTKTEIIEEFILQSQNLTFAEIRKITPRKILVAISTKELGKLLIGGIITGSGVSVMHYIGMSATMFNGRIEWNPGLVTLSVVIAIVASSVAFWIFFRLLSIFPDLELLRIGSALIMAIAVCGMHYTGMVAGTYHVKDHVLTNMNKEESMDDKGSFLGALIGANIMLWAMVLYALWNSRTIMNKQAKLIRQADQILQKITDEKTPSVILGTSHGSSNSNATSSGPVIIRHMAEAYMTKRYRGLQMRVLTSQDGSLILERQQQLNMGFFEYMLHLFLLAVTCKWRRLWYAIMYEGEGSVNGSSHNSHDTSHNNHHFPHHRHHHDGSVVLHPGNDHPHKQDSMVHCTDSNQASSSGATVVVDNNSVNAPVNTTGGVTAVYDEEAGGVLLQAIPFDKGNDIEEQVLYGTERFE